LNTLNMQKTEDLVSMLRGLHDKRSNLGLELDELRQKLNEYEDSYTAEQTLYDSMSAETKRLLITNGLVKVTGPGVSVIIYGDSPLLFLDIIDIVNELWSSGAEAISINERRIDFNTKIYDATVNGSLEIMINEEVLLYPVIIQAIGDPATLETGLTFPGGIVDNLSTLYNIHPEIKRETEIMMQPVIR
ncbi:MAG: DUF881 domain-containing protein, partial [Bacillota bacterium]|nr:DUF881 domain-containing protein [Bacillota bacterium]